MRADFLYTTIPSFQPGCVTLVWHKRNSRRKHRLPRKDKKRIGHRSFCKFTNEGYYPTEA